MLRLGLSCAILHADPGRPVFGGKALHCADDEVSAAITRAGALPFLLPALHDPRALAALVAGVDALVLTGGADVSPLAYGEAPLRPEWSGDPRRDAYERALLDAALALGRPILAICRGVQLLNVALGGSLWQDLPSQRPGEIRHRDPDRYDDHDHHVAVDPASWLHAIYGATELVVNSVHHQGIRRLARPLRAVAHAPDGLVEAVEWAGDERLIIGVQWHPEWLPPTHPRRDERSSGDALFAAFVDAIADGHRWSSDDR